MPLCPTRVGRVDHGPKESGAHVIGYPTREKRLVRHIVHEAEYAGPREPAEEREAARYGPLERPVVDACCREEPPVDSHRLGSQQ